MRTRLAWIALTWLVLFAACSDDAVDLTGIYRVDAAVSSEPCGADQPIAMPPAYLAFTKADLFGTPYFSWEQCTDEAATDCTSLGGLFNGFYEPVDGGWLGVITSSSPANGSCLLSYKEQTAILDGNLLAIEINSYREMVTLPMEECAPEEAERRNDSMPCIEHVHYDTTKL